MSIVDSTAAERVAVHRVAVIGAGLLGRRLAALCSRAGYSVMLEDVLPSRLRGAARQFEHSDASSRSDASSPRDVKAPSGETMPGMVEFATTIEEAVREADLVIDCVPDELESKLEILSLIDRMAPPRAIIATPTRALSIADLASCTYRADRCLALELPHEILEADTDCLPCAIGLVQTGSTDPQVLDAVVAFCRSVGFSETIRLDAGR